MDAGASQAIKNRDGWFPIHLASYLGHIDIVTYLLDTSSTNKSSPDNDVICVYDDTDRSRSRCCYNYKLYSSFSYVNKKTYRSEQESSDESNEEEEEEEDENESQNTTSDEDDQDEIESGDDGENSSLLLSSSSLSSLVLHQTIVDELLCEDITDLKNLDLSARDFLF